MVPKFSSIWADCVAPLERNNSQEGVMASHGNTSESDFGNNEQIIRIITTENAPMTHEALQRLSSGAERSSVRTGENFVARDITSSGQDAGSASAVNHLLGAERSSQADFMRNLAHPQGHESYQMSTNMLAPLANDRRTQDVFFFQQQLLQTQKMFFEQQATMKALSDSVEKLQEHIGSSSKNRTKSGTTNTKEEKKDTWNIIGRIWIIRRRNWWKWYWKQWIFFTIGGWKSAERLGKDFHWREHDPWQ